MSATRRPGAERRFLVLGCGSIGRRHIENLSSLSAGSITAFDTRAERREALAFTPGVGTVDRLEAAWAQDPDVVVVATPTSLHAPLALAAAERGCHLFIEKPLSHSMEGVDRLLREVRDRRLVTLVGCNMRFHPGLRAVKTLVEQGAIGRIVAARVEVGHYLPDWHPWEDYRHTYSARRDLGGGVILDAIHEIDYVRWLLGSVVAVTCFSGRLSALEIETEDTAALLLKFASGAIGEVHLDYVQRAYSRTCHVIGEEGTIHWDYVSGDVRCYSARRGGWETMRRAAEWRPNEMYLDEMRHFLRALAGEETPMLDVFEASRVLDVALAAKMSSDSGRAVLVQG